MCKFCTTEDATSSILLKDTNQEYRGESCQIYYFGENDGIVCEGNDAIPYLCFFSKIFGSKPSFVKINNCPWCGRDLSK